MALEFVDRCNAFSRQKCGGYKPAPCVPAIIGQSCILCITRSTCLGSSCLGDNGRLHFIWFPLQVSLFSNVIVLPKVCKQTDLGCANELSGNIPGCNFVTGGARLSKRSKLNRLLNITVDNSCSVLKNIFL